MARPLFEQYKDALRRGHVALLNDELEPALVAYREAAALVPDRPLPYASIAGVLERLGRPAEAVAAYDASLALAPDDAAVVAARAALAASLPSVAAPAPPAVDAPVPPAADAPLPTEERPPAAEVPIAPAARSQPEIVSAAEPPPPDPEAEARRAAANAAAAAAEAAAAAADAAALDAMRAALEPRAEGEPDGAGDDGEIAASHAGPASPSTESTPAGDPSEPSYYVDRAPVVVMDEERNWPAIDLPSLPPEPFVGPPPDPATLQADADALVDRGDTAGARDALLLAVAVHREAGRLDAALDAGLQVLAVAPGDPQVHLAIANLQLDRGWRSVATEKIELLLRLTSLSGDSQAEADVHLLAADRLRDEDPARLDARRRGVPTA